MNYQGEWGLFYGGTEVFWKNLVAAIGVAAYSFVMAYLLFRWVDHVTSHAAVGIALHFIARRHAPS